MWCCEVGMCIHFNKEEHKDVYVKCTTKGTYLLLWIIGEYLIGYWDIVLHNLNLCPLM